MESDRTPIGLKKSDRTTIGLKKSDRKSDRIFGPASDMRSPIGLHAGPIGLRASPIGLSTSFLAYVKCTLFSD